jgi:RNA polymerase sigma-70 factor (ECF subfamily)
MDQPTAELQASLDVARKQFLATMGELRPKLHRFCTRMCGSSLDGEDVVQEVLAQAFYNLPMLRDRSRLEPWLFRIAHHKCVDLLRREKRLREDTVAHEEAERAEGSAGEPANESLGEPIGETLAPLVTQLPPKERAAVLLKDVLQYRLSEVAEIVESTVAGVKAALHRGRAKLRELHAKPSETELDHHQRTLLTAYVDCFNRRDWDALRRLIQADATLDVLERYAGPMASANYFGNYGALPWEWRLSLGRVDGEPVILHWKRFGAEWRPHAAIRLWWRDGKVSRIRDYLHVDYVLQGATTEPDGEPD